MKLRILKPTSTVPYLKPVQSVVDGKTVTLMEQRFRSYHPADPDGEDVGVEIDEAIAAEWIRTGAAEDFAKPRKARKVAAPSASVEAESAPKKAGK